MAGQDLSRNLRGVDLGDGTAVRIRYEQFLRSGAILRANETLADHPEIALDVYRDWQRRRPVACIFARLIASEPVAYDVAWEVVPDKGDQANARKIATEVVKRVAPAVGQEEAIAVLLPGIDDPEAFVAFCKAIGEHEDWSVRAPFNPSDKFERCYIRITNRIGPNVDAEVLGVGPFDFLPATRRAPILALHVRTRPLRAKRRVHNATDKAHLADIEWPEGRGRRFEQFWSATVERRLEVLGGDDSAARARITFAVPRRLWEEVEI